MLKCQLVAASKNLITSKPNIDCTPYDLIIDDNGKILRAQVKYCSKYHSGVKSSIELALWKTNGRPYYTDNEIDVILVYVPHIDKVLIYNKEKFHKKTTIGINLVDKESPNYWERFVW